ncbi:MAG: hypothetical protein K6F57_03695 [Candidatus Saccharibacteria bacterium]|nr:hypothetical protein [Candidatus Saccharibacteria bacterium]
METTCPNVEIYIDFSFTLYTSNFADATAAEAAAAKALNRMTQKINMPIKKYETKISEEGSIYKTVIEAQTEGRADFKDYKQTYAWRDMVHDVAKSMLTKWKLKSWLLINKFPNGYSYTLHRTEGSDISGCNANLN